MSEKNFKVYENKDFPIGVFSQKAYLPTLHHHIEYELFCLDEGEVELVIDNESKVIFSGETFFLEPETEHCVRKTKGGKGFHYEAFVFDVSVLGGEKDPCRRFFESIRINRFLAIPPSFFEKMKQCADFCKNKTPGNEIFTKTVLLEMISYIIQTGQYKAVCQVHTLSKYNVAAVDTAILYIREHYRENITALDITSHTDYSRSHFSRLFRKIVGLNIVEYINKYRIEKSCVDLIYTDKNITQIALENGFNNIQYFSRVFFQFMNCTPKQYQRSAQDVVVPSSIPDGIL